MNQYISEDIIEQVNEIEEILNELSYLCEEQDAVENLISSIS